MALTDEQLATFRRDGRLVCRGLVAADAASRARRLIHHHIGRDGIDPDRLPDYRAKSYCPSIQDHPAITALANASGVLDAAGSLLGPDRVEPVKSAQIALRFPGHEDHDHEADARKIKDSHIDGIGTGINGIPVHEYRRGFALLAVVLLRDLPDEDCGNFHTVPGSHLEIASAFAAQDELRVDYDAVPRCKDRPREQLTGRAGDVAFAHYLTLHGVSPHRGPDIRYAAIFRLRARGMAPDWRQALVEPWCDYAGIDASQTDLTDDPSRG